LNFAEIIAVVGSLQVYTNIGQITYGKDSSRLDERREIVAEVRHNAAKLSNNIIFLTARSREKLTTSILSLHGM
jgi:hypothetical protein